MGYLTPADIQPLVDIAASVIIIGGAVFSIGVALKIYRWIKYTL